MATVDVSKLAAGRVGVGFSDPCVGLYNGTGAPGTHTQGMKLARGVNVNFNITTADDSVFYADDVAAESDTDMFSSGTATLVVDGLHAAAERFISGEPEPEEVDAGWMTVPLTRTGRTAVAPYVGFGFIRVYQSAGVMMFVPIVLPKAKFQQNMPNGETQTERKNYQTTTLTADLFRIDDDSNDWRWIGPDYTTRDEARRALHALLGFPEETAPPAADG